MAPAAIRTHELSRRLIAAFSSTVSAAAVASVSSAGLLAMGCAQAPCPSARATTNDPG